MKKQVITQCIATLSAMCILVGAASMPASAERLSSYEAVTSSCESNSDRSSYDKRFYSLDRTESDEYLKKNENTILAFPQEFSVETVDSFDSFDDEEFRLAEKERIRQEIENQIIRQMSFEKNASVNLKSDVNKAAAYKISIPGTFTIYHQEKSNYCVAACVQSVLQYMNESDPPAQNKIFNSTSTNVSKIPFGMKYYCSNSDYIYKNAPTTSYMLSCFHYDVVECEIPAFAGIQSTQSQWRYETLAGGHCLVVNAIYNDSSKIQFADPAYSDTIPAFYTESKNRVSKVCKKVVW